MAITICETCGAVTGGEPDICHTSGSHIAPRGEIRRLPHEVVLGFLKHAGELVRQHSQRPDEQ